MAKLTKSVLKGIVKECLVEILSEGVSLSPDSLVSKTVKKSNPKQRRLSENHDSVDLKAFDEKVDNTVNALTDDPIMKEIFADTAKSTLQEQLQHDGKNGKGTNTGHAAQPSIDLDNIFKGVSTNWSKLAFSKSGDDNLT